MRERRARTGAAALGRALIRKLQLAVPPGGGGVTILAYHLVGAATDSPVDLPEGVFRGQMAELARRGSAIPLAALVDSIERRRPFDSHRVVVTFDDAYENFGRRVRPILAELGIPATLFVPTDFVDRGRGGPLAGAADLPPMGWRELGALREDGLVELGSHSRSHPDLRRLSDDDLAAELTGSAEVIERETGARPAAFCYPRALRSRRAEAAVARVYRAAVVGGGRTNDPRRAHTHRLERVSLRRDMPASLGEILDARVVLEEWLADRIRHLRRGGAGTPSAAATA